MGKKKQHIEYWQSLVAVHVKFDSGVTKKEVTVKCQIDGSKNLKRKNEQDMFLR